MEGAHKLGAITETNNWLKKKRVSSNYYYLVTRRIPIAAATGLPVLLGVRTHRHVRQLFFGDLASVVEKSLEREIQQEFELFLFWVVKLEKNWARARNGIF